MKKSFRKFGWLLLLCWFGPAHAQLGSLVNPGPLSSPHHTLEGIKNCTQCHATANGIPDSKCLNCHGEIQQRINQHRGFHSHVSGDCIKCHGEHKGLGYDLAGLSRMKFDHTETGWPLTGKHSSVDCSTCHTKTRRNVMTGIATKQRTYLGTDSGCKSCHNDPHQSKKPLFQQCYKCHDTSTWTPRPQSNFSHSRETGFELTGSHTDLKCNQCHQKKIFSSTPMACVSCHKDPHDKRFGLICENCHNTKSWASASQRSSSVPAKPGKSSKGGSVAIKPAAGFDHNKTRFPLDGKHKIVTCKGCHGPVIGKMDHFQDCNGCHQNPHGTQFQLRYTAKTCSNCHVTEGFKKLSFDHNKDSRFEILGKHTEVKCNQCHMNGKFRWMDSTPDCVACHVDVHKGQFAPAPCASCHTYDGFQKQKFDHEKTGFPLIGKHKLVACETCHVNSKFKGIGRACNSCHNDFHKGELGMECERCHSPAKSFTDVEFNHNREAKFKIDGAHMKNQCNQCHWNNKYKLGEFTCLTCHVDVHKGAMGTKCDKCHVTTGFVLPEGFHNFGTFQITGVHNKMDCVTCHNPKAPARARTMECQNCHKDPHMGSAKKCFVCHGQNAWKPAPFDHNQTKFSLTGAHQKLSCNRCHANRVFGGLSLECISCHTRDFDPKLPDHIGVPNTCDTCHTTTRFKPTK